MNQKYADVLPMSEVIAHLKSKQTAVESFNVLEMEEAR